MKIAVAANLSKNSHFELERRPGLDYAIRKGGHQARWISIADVVREQRLSGVRAAESLLERCLEGVDAFLLHKELLFAITPDFLRRVSGKGILTVGFIGDEEWDLQSCFDFIPVFDVSVVYSSKAMRHYQRYSDRIIHLPVCATFDEPYGDSSEGLPVEDIDVLFIGRPYGPRAAIINFLIQNGIDVAVFGSEKWKGLLPKENYRGYLENDNYNMVLARAKIILGLMEAPTGGVPHINAKIFDGAKAKKLAICTYYPPFLEDYGLIEGQSVVTYKSRAELLEKLRHFLRNKSDRDQIARNQSAILRAQFDYKVQYSNLLTRLQQRVSGLTAVQARKSDPAGADSIGPQHELWRSMNVRSSLQFDNFLPQILDAYSNLPGPVVIHSVYCDQVVIKRLPLVDSASVFVRRDASRPISVFGLTFVGRRWKTAYFPLGYYKDRDMAAAIVAALNGFTARVLSWIRKEAAV